MTTNDKAAAEVAPQTESPTQLVYGSRTAAKVMGIGIGELRRMVREGEIGHLKTAGGQYRVPRAAIETWIATHTIEPRA